MGRLGEQENISEIVKGRWQWMEGGGLSFLSPEHRPLFNVGGSVHVFEGTGTGQVKMMSVA